VIIQFNSIQFKNFI